MDTSNLDLAGKYAQIIEAIAVVISVIYIAIQVRVSTRATKGQTYQNIVVAMGEIETRISESNELAKIYNDGRNSTTKLSDTELIRFNEIISSLMNLLENLYYQYDKGFLEKDMWEGWSTYLFHLMEYPGVIEWWGKYNKYFSKSFRDYIAEEKEERAKTERLSSANRAQ